MLVKFDFFAKQVSGYVEDDVCVVAFAETSNPDPSRYLIFSETLFQDASCGGEEGQSFSLEMAGIDVPAVARISLFSLHEDRLTVHGTAEDTTDIEIEIRFSAQYHSLLEQHLPMIVSKSGTELEIR